MENAEGDVEEATVDKTRLKINLKSPVNWTLKMREYY